MTAELVKKQLISGNLAILTGSCIGKTIILMFLSSSRDKFTLLSQNSVTDVSVDFQPPCWCLSGWAPTWRLHKHGVSINLDDSRDLILGEVVYIVVIYHFPDS